MGAVLDLCNRGVFLNGGKVAAIGDTKTVVDTYVKHSTRLTGDVKFERRASGLTSELRFTAARVLDQERHPVAAVDLDDGFILEIDYEITAPIRSAILSFELWSATGSCIYCSSDLDATPERLRDERPKGRYTARCRVPTGYLRPGYYWIDIAASVTNEKVLDVVQNAISFEINGLTIERKLSQGRRGVIIPAMAWETTRVS